MIMAFPELLKSSYTKEPLTVNTTGPSTSSILFSAWGPERAALNETKWYNMVMPSGEMSSYPSKSKSCNHRRSACLRRTKGV